MWKYKLSGNQTKKNSTQHRWLPTKSYIDLSTAFYRLYEQAAAYSLLLGWQLQTGAAWYLLATVYDAYGRWLSFWTFFFFYKLGFKSAPFLILSFSFFPSKFKLWHSGLLCSIGQQTDVLFYSELKRLMLTFASDPVWQDPGGLSVLLSFSSGCKQDSLLDAWLQCDSNRCGMSLFCVWETIKKKKT